MDFEKRRADHYKSRRPVSIADTPHPNHHTGIDRETPPQQPKLPHPKHTEPPNDSTKQPAPISSIEPTKIKMKNLSLILLASCTIQTINAAAPTRPDEADRGAVPVTAPVNVKSTLLKLSPEQLVVASMPWEGMDQPEAQRKAIFPRQDPWDTPADSTMHRPFGHYAAIPARPPPFIPGDVDVTDENLGAERMNEQDWMRQSRVPSLPAVGPAFYGRDMKPENYYLNPLAKHSPFAMPIMTLLETTSSPPSFLPFAHPQQYQQPYRYPHHRFQNHHRHHYQQHQPLQIQPKRRLRSTPTVPSFRSNAYSLIETSTQSTGNNYWDHHLQRMQAVGVHLETQSAAPNDFGGFDGGKADFKKSKFIIPPVAINKGLGGTPPALAVLGDQSVDQMVAPRVQQFTGAMNWQKDLKEGKPIVQPYASDHPSAYQQQPLWPPAPPEPLFPLKGEDRR